MLTKHKRFTALAMLIGAIALLAMACSQPAPAAPAAPAGPSADEIRAIIQEEVANVPAPEPMMMPEPAPAGPSAEEIAMMVQEAVEDAVPEGVDADEIGEMVESAVMMAQEDSLSGDDIEDLVSSAVMEAAESQPEPLSASEVEAIVAAAISAIPTPEPMMMPEPVMTGPSGDPIKIGTLFSYTGGLAPYGPAIRNGSDLAAELINDAGGVLGRPVEPVHRDSGSSAQVATDSARGLITAEGVQAIVGALSSGVTIPVAQSVTIPNNTILMSPASTAPAISVLDDNDYVFRTAPSDAAQGVILARLAHELGYESAATMYINNPYGEGLSRVFTEHFEAAGGTVTAQVPHEDEMPTYLSELENATADSPDVLLALSYPIAAEVYLREAIEGGLIDTFLFVDGTKNQDMFDNLAQAGLNGMYGTAPGGEESDSKALYNYLSQERFGEEPGLFSGEAFDAMAIIALAVEKAGAYESEAVRDALREVAAPPGIIVGPGEFAYAIELIQAGEDINYEGVSGSHDFDANGDVYNTIEIWMIQDGAITSTGRFETP